MCVQLAEKIPFFGTRGHGCHCCYGSKATAIHRRCGVCVSRKVIVLLEITGMVACSFPEIVQSIEEFVPPEFFQNRVSMRTPFNRWHLPSPFIEATQGSFPIDALVKVFETRLFRATGV